jgi:hypothetical protein
MTYINPTDTSTGVLTQDFGNAKLKNVADPTDQYDGMNNNQAQIAIASLPRYYKSGTRKNNVWMYDTSATVSSGTATFWLTTNGTSTGTAVLTNIYTESANFTVFDGSNLYNYSNFTIAADKKSLTVTVNKQAFTSSSGLINLLGGVLNFLTGVVFNSAANGTVIYLQIKGD